MIAIIDYGMGNLHSVENALKKIGAECVITSDKEVIQKADKIILPGVGAFQDCMKNLKDTDLYDVLKSEVSEQKKPFLGICLGMQAIFESSMENGYCEGFGFLKGQVIRMQDPNIRIPHIGWNLLEKEKEHPVYAHLSARPFVYYDHSYYAQDYNPEDLIGYSCYGIEKIPGLVGHENVLGAQFHPEKSAKDGLAILKYFVEEFK